MYKFIEQLLFNNYDSKNFNYMNLTAKDQDEILKTIQDIIKSGFNISNINNKNNPSLTIGEFTSTITSTLIQNINNKNQIRNDLGKCEDELKNKYKISKNDSLYLLIVNGRIDNIPKVEYEVFYPFFHNNFSTLNLSICKNMKIDISLPINISLDEIDKYNKSSGLYNDICYTLTTENDTDITLKDRRKDYIEKNYSVSEEDCDFTEYDIDLKRAKCSCLTKLKLPLISEIKVDKDKLISNFKDIRNIGNFKMLKRTHLLFNKDNIFKNSANYIIFIVFIIGILAKFIFVFYNYNKIRNYITLLEKNLKKNGEKLTNNVNENKKIKLESKGKIKETNDDIIKRTKLNKEHKKI